MADDGLEYSTDDKDLHTKSNRKTIVVGRGRQLNSLVTTYPGQYAYCTETENGFTIDNYYQRNAANSSWVEDRASHESAEYTSDTVVDNVQNTLNGKRRYALITLPSTDKFYVATKIEWKNGTTISGNVTCGIDLLDANPPQDAHTILLASSEEVAQAGVSSLQSVTLVNSQPMRAGQHIGVWISCSDSTGTFRENNAASSMKREKTSTYSASPAMGNTDAWITTTDAFYIILYYRGIG